MNILGLDLERLVRIVEASEIDSLEIEGILGSVKITKPEGYEVRTCYIPPLQEKKKIDKERREMKYEDIISKEVGIFYTTDPRVPKAKPYVKKGSKVKKGDIVALIVRLGLYDEIHAPCDGRIRGIYVHNNKPIEYNKPLFKIRHKN